jgi:chemotaxis response regulator CheB
MQRPSGLEANLKPDQQRIIAIGGSAGAISAIRALCDTLPADIPAAVCIVVHVGARGHNLSRLGSFTNRRRNARATRLFLKRRVKLEPVTAFQF